MSGKEVNHCCRLSQETIVAIVRNRSGIDSGEIDYTLKCDRFEKQSVGCLEDIISTMKTLIVKCQERMAELKGVENEKTNCNM